MLMTVGAAGMGYMTIVNYQGEVSESTTTGTEHVSSLGKSKIKIESASEGTVYVRNMGSEPLEKILVLVEGRPVDFSGPDTCEPGKVCVFEIGESVECPEGSCEVRIETALGSSLIMTVDEEDVEPYPPEYSDWSLNTTSVLFSEYILANVTWTNGTYRCPLIGGCYWFSNHTTVTEEVDEVMWGRWD
jgi:archaellum component FlaF (FlaF/FlaG flagellin family)